MNLKEIDKQISEILNTEYHSDKILNELIQIIEIHQLIRSE